jgi:RNA 3'-terminal phosphate cyclase (ATP)
LAALCRADTRGAALNSQTLTFVPQSRPIGGEYDFDVADAAKGGSAGSITLIFQAMLIPLLFAQEPSSIRLRGGTHVPYSPPYHFISKVFQPALSKLGVTFSTSLTAWGWYPRGQGEITAIINPQPELKSFDFSTIGKTMDIYGVAAVTNLPAHIPQRMAQQAIKLLSDSGLVPKITPLREKGAAPGAGIFLWTDLAGFSSLGRPGLAAEKVAKSAVADCLAFVENRVTVGPHLADQLLLPLALPTGHSSFTTNNLTSHTITNAQLLRRWLDVEIEIGETPGKTGYVTVKGIGFSL